MKTVSFPNRTISIKSIEEFISSLRGELIVPDDEKYNDSRQVYNAMIDRYPAAIVYCEDVADVISCVKFAKREGIITAIRAGGHNGGGLGIVDDGLVIDLSKMNGIRVDPNTNTVRAEGGCLLRDLDHATSAFGKAVPAGIFSTTGISGLTLGGGLGHLSRAYGLSIDNLIEADVVLADGSLVKTSEDSLPDLFWAIRGGGGNFGVVTSFLFRLQDVSNIQAGPILWHLEDAEEIMPFYQDFILSAPNEIYCYFAFLTVPPVSLFPEHLHLKKMCGLVWCNVGDGPGSEKALKYFRDFKTPALDYVGPMPFVSLQSMFDALYPKGLQWYWKANFVKNLTEKSIAENIKYAHQMPTSQCTMHLYPVNGACHQKSSDDTAWGYRGANWSQVIVGVDQNPIKKEEITNWAKEYWDAVHPHSEEGGYVNFMMEEGLDRIKASYGKNYEKLSEIKEKYDSDNFFRVNQNIRPKNQTIQTLT
ncbi:FAD-dependent oxidoreductase [Algoriphagus sp. D3-2-R+10]|uniref:FAD-binding oxidoreductase n=1 Tax=Algoriphagus aurantiacus TaxID=3103948 RepID=UPI002B38146D|nr:FAD-dependent oxidoreductase [Algoriphagus sp. D3-2-R+10]MEB2776639.1 FAD-dependent oxidoreductase [Algoriphagus sp. D3-2-R+10]